MKLLLIQLVVATTLTIFCLTSCSKSGQPNNDCTYPDIVPFQPYSQPVWHPNGKIFGFNFTPLSAIIPSSNTSSSCIWYFYSPKDDSTGFYIMNINGSGFTRITNYAINCPSWSPDGKWLAFSSGGNIYKMHYNGVNFDTANIKQLTSQGANFYPSWTINSDTIYYDSNVGTNGKGYFIWSMASDSSGKTGYPNSGRYPFIGSDGRVYYIGLGGEIYSMNKDGTGKEKFSNNGFGVERPKYWNGNVFYEGNQIGVVTSKGMKGHEIISPAVTYDISNSGKIIYSKMVYSITSSNNQIGTLWLINSDGTNSIQITFNHL